MKVSNETSDNVRVVRCLDQSKHYVFMLTGKQMTHPLTPPAFLASPAGGNRILSVAEDADDRHIDVWSSENGWQEAQYALLAQHFAQMICSDCELTSEFIVQCISDDLDVIEAVNSWFNDSDTNIDIHDNQHGFIDFTVNDDWVRRVCISPMPKTSEYFNLYYGDNSKGNIKWIGDLVLSIAYAKTRLNQTHYPLQEERID